MEQDEYSEFAEIYDKFYIHTEDIEFYVKIAEKFGDPILELGCGTGRITIPIARNGYNVVGLDASEKMLQILEKKLNNEPDEVRKRIRLVHGDMRKFDLEQKFKLIIIPFSSIVHITNLDDIVDVFKSSYRHLAEEGALVFDVFNPNLKYLMSRVKNSFDIRSGDAGEKIYLWETARYDLTNQWINMKRLVEIEKKDERKRYTWETKLRYYYWGELYLALKLAGFKKIEMYGDFNLGKFEYSKGRIVTIAKK